MASQSQNNLQALFSDHELQLADLNVNEHTAHDKASNSVFSLRGPEVFKIVSRIKKILVSVLFTINDQPNELLSPGLKCHLLKELLGK